MSTTLEQQPQAPKHPAQVLLERRQVRRSYEAWCRYALAHLNLEPAAHHLLLIRTIEKVLSGAIKNVIFLMPPGSAKSTYLSVLLPPFYLNPEQSPRNLILACSYSYTLIEGFGRQCRDLINLHENILGYSLSKTAAAAGDWRTSANGGYFCAGVGSGIAGHRADLAFIDDYLGSQEDADSKVIREKQWLWYLTDFRPRLKPSAATIIIANRRHEDDLVGRLLIEEPNKWTVIRLPMLAEENDPLGRSVGERLWSTWFTDSMVADAKRQPRVWAGLYQQRPAPEEGNYFKADSIKTYKREELPKDLRIYVGSDFAFRKGTDSDRTCFLPAGVDSEGVLWILPDWFWNRVDTLEGCNAMLDMSKRRSPIVWWAGKENITGSIAPFLYKLMQERNIYVPIDELSEARDKEAKAQPIKARMQAGMVKFPEFAEGWDVALNELLTFPGGLHDDFVDALAKLGQGLSLMVSSSLKPTEKTVEQVLNRPITCGWAERSSSRKQSRHSASRFESMQN